ncbi:MAG: Flp pilus assembly complex ATPase component TadA [Planctomycetes bacterium]|nr:Flp pilus assembly complex ATPase component TadA [Planctomycetota bacterium]
MTENLLMTLVAAANPGFYIMPVKLVVFCLLLVPWLWACGWADRDTRITRMPREIWLTVAVGAGVAGLLVWLLVPIYLIGLGIYVVLLSTVASVYVMQRNAKVVPGARVLTSEWFATILERKRDRSVNLDAKLKLYDSQKQPAVLPVDGTVEEKTIFNRTQDLLYDVMWRRASEVDLSPASAEELQVRYVIDGMVVPSDPLERPLGDQLIDYLKELAGMDLEDRRRPQSGKIAVDLAGQQVDIDLVAAGSTSGPRMQMKVLQEAVRTRLAELGMLDDVLQAVRKVTGQPKGLVLAASKPRNGLTSTLYSLMRDHDAYTQHLMTVEAAPEADMENITQNTYANDADEDRVVAGVLRRDPDVLMVDRAATTEAARRLVEAAGSVKVIVGVSARDSFYALATWVKTVGDPAAAVRPLTGVLSQVLMRKLCPDCREAYQPNADLLRKANLPADRAAKFYRPPKELTDEKGRPIICPTCQGSGYFGRTAAFELLVLDDELRKLIASGAGLTQIKAAARKNGMLYLQEQALRLVMEGITSVEEVIRVTRTK